MATTGTAMLTISELREFASFTPDEQLFIERALDIGLGRGDAFKIWSRAPGDCKAIRGQYLAYRELRRLREAIPAIDGFEGVGLFLGTLTRVSALDIAQGSIESFSAYRFLYERLLGARVRPWLPSTFCAAAALPVIEPGRRKLLLRSLSETAATAPAWSEREPCFFPERIEAEAA